MRQRFSHFHTSDHSSHRHGMQREFFDPTQWRRLLNLGIAFILSGVIAIALPQLATSALNILLGILILLIGLAAGRYAFYIRKFSGDRWPLLTAIAFIAFGLLLIVYPKFGALSLTFIIAIFLVISGVAKLTLAQWIPPHASRIWIYLSAVVDLLLSALIIVNLGTTADWLLGLLLGVSLITHGWWNTRLAINLQKMNALYQ